MSTTELERPTCRCHDKPMRRNGPGHWKCAIRDAERQRRLYRANPEPARERSRRRYAAHSEWWRENDRQRYAADPESRKAQVRRWQEANRERVLNLKRRHRARQFGASRVDLTLEQWEAVRIEFGGRCVYCGGPPETMDHDQPLSRDGAHSRLNVVPACGRCNNAKHHRTGAEWAPALLDFLFEHLNAGVAV